MSAAVPSTVALTTIADGSAIVASDHRNNYSSVQTAINALVAVGALATAKGDVLVASTSGTYDRLAVGSTGQQLVADSTQTLGVKWVGGMSLVADSTLGVAAASFDFTGLPAAYAHLRVVFYGTSDQAATQSILLRLNNDSTADYDYETLVCSGTATSVTENYAQTSMIVGYLAAASASAGRPGMVVIDIPQYAGTTLEKTLVASSATKAGTTAGSLLKRDTSGFWRSPTAINRVTLLASTGNFVAGSRCSIYAMGS